MSQLRHFWGTPLSCWLRVFIDRAFTALWRKNPQIFLQKDEVYARWTTRELQTTVFGMDTNAPFALRGDKKQLEEALDFAPKFDKDGLIPALAMDATTKEPLMLAYMNAESLRRTLEIGEAVYWSRSRQEFWHKGATSGHIQRIVEIRTDCDQDALILLVEQIGAGACHTGRGSCFYRKVIAPTEGETAKLEWIGPGKSFDPAAVYGKP